MTYNKALEFINSTLVFGSKPGLSRIGRLLELLGNPQKKLKFIHIAGTNGKGSTCTFIACALKEAGYKTGLYTSPFVIDFRERIQINNEYIAKKDIAKLVQKVIPLCKIIENESESPTEFEIITALAFLYFKQQKCDFVVLETGLGGRFDATNIIDKPLISVITSISFDHMQYLGDTIEKIAFEKCGIIKKNGITVVYPLQEKTALKMINNRAEQKKNELIIPLIKHLNFLKTGLLGSEFEYKGHKFNICLLGEFQVFNAITAIETLFILNVPIQAIFKGLANAKIPARFEIISKNPLIIIDGAHNEDGIEKLLESINTYLFDKNLIVIMGMLKDKTYEKAISKIAKISNSFIAVTPNNSRALNANDVSFIAKRFCKDVYCAKTIKMGAKKALSLVDENSAVLVCGSLYIAGKLRDLLLN